MVGRHNLFLLNESEWEKLRIMELALGALPLCNRTLGWRKVHFLYSCATNDVPSISCHDCLVMTLLMWFGSRRLLLRIFNNVRKIAIYSV